MHYIKISISLQTQEEFDICIAQMDALGYEGFEEKENQLEAFIPEHKFEEKKLAEELSQNAYSFTKEIVEQKNWNEEWERNFLPVIIGDFCAIRANFHQTITTVRNEIIVTPKMSFGTGHHPSTYLMVQAMSQIEFKGKTVFDFGTGTGILSILAEKLGAERIWAIDLDDWSIENAMENIKENHSGKIEIEKNDRIPTSKYFDIILANINKSVILAYLPRIRQQLTNQGVLLLSGLLVIDSEECRQKAADTGFTIQRQLYREDWTCIELRKTNLQKQLTLE